MKKNNSPLFEPVTSGLLVESLPPCSVFVGSPWIADNVRGAAVRLVLEDYPNIFEASQICISCKFAG